MDFVHRGAVVGDELPGKTVIGSNNTIGHHAVVGVKCQDLKYKVCLPPPPPVYLVMIMVINPVSCTKSGSEGQR